eukprot:scaffold185428_cov15-Tisochrysis_lutea.AAC.1
MPAAHLHTLIHCHSHTPLPLQQNNLPAQYLGQQASFTPVPGSLPPTPMHSYLRPPAPSASDDESQLFFNRYLHA